MFAVVVPAVQPQDAAAIATAKQVAAVIDGKVVFSEDANAGKFFINGKQPAGLFKMQQFGHLAVHPDRALALAMVARPVRHLDKGIRCRIKLTQHHIRTRHPYRTHACSSISFS